MKEQDQEAYWTGRYEEENTGWDIGYPSTPLKMYIDQLTDKDLQILIPGAGNSYEAEYLFNEGFKNIHVLDISALPLQALKKRVSEFPDSQLLQEDFFRHTGQYDLILEQTFFCSFEPSVENRRNYAKKMHALLKPNGKLVGVWFKHPLIEGAKRPYGGTRAEYLEYFEDSYEVVVFEDCYNSIKPRMGNELFGIFKKS